MKPPWTKYYYDILDFYFWEPQHLGKEKNPDSKYLSYSDIFNHLGKMEVSLNHQLALFFNIIPESILNTLLNTITKQAEKEKYTYDSDKTRKIIEGLNDFTQPDFIFEGTKSLLALEVKLDSTSSMDQLMKYLLLFVLLKKKMKNIKKYNLVFLAKNEFRNVWNDELKDTDEILKEFETYEIPDFTAKGGIDIRPFKKEIRDVVLHATISFVNFTGVSSLLDREKEQLKNKRLGKGWIKFIEGIQKELRDRKIV